eukprot:CAMPEP_0116117528 /NCGR_PEP_ID=MMETSP0329-20121206/1620_1 /TAXON_ID=697910 /ORGANISM="Pseudo-nitzschia arenysensis, Strain B593" /LENGTH=544 /DNA_ID=CAMNT_0003611097 /DNA_START=190 /DNA_END=1824 /DNA_ORIENTATION=-
MNTFRPSYTFALLAALLFQRQLSTPEVTAYVNIKSYVPEPRKIEYLKKITGEIIDHPTGELSDAMISDSHMVMKGWSTTKYRTSSKENAVAIENIVKRLVDEAEAGNANANPTTKDYNCMLESWARSGEGVYAAERCEEILTQMETEFESGVSPQIQPNLSSFKIVLQAWKHAGGQNLSSFGAQRILDWMTTLYDEGKNNLVQPDQMCFDTVLQSWSRNNHEQAPVYAERLLAKMETMRLESTAIVPLVQPRTVSFNAVLGAWGRASLSPTSPSAFATQPSATSWQRSCDILQFMEKLYYEEGDTMVEPDRNSYSLVLKSLSRHKTDSKAAIKADEILRFVEKKYKGGDLSWRPDTLLVNTVLGCWSHSHLKGSYRKTRGILDRQILLFTNLNGKAGSEDCRPDVYGYTSVLSSCAAETGNDTDKAKAFNVALSTYQELIAHSDEYGPPNHVTYGTMLTCISKLLPSDTHKRKKWTKKIFNQAIANGCVDDYVWSRLRQSATSSKEFKDLTKGKSKKRLPSSWTQNVNERYSSKKRVSGKRAEV